MGWEDDLDDTGFIVVEVDRDAAEEEGDSANLPENVLDPRRYLFKISMKFSDVKHAAHNATKLVMLLFFQLWPGCHH